MKIIIPGHRYDLENIDGDGYQTLQFVDRGHGRDSEGITNQEILKVLINRMIFLDQELPWEWNKKIIYKLREILLLHEIRVLQRKLEKGQILPEEFTVSKADGHWIIK